MPVAWLIVAPENVVQYIHVIELVFPTPYPGQAGEAPMNKSPRSSVRFRYFDQSVHSRFRSLQPEQKSTGCTSSSLFLLDTFSLRVAAHHQEHFIVTGASVSERLPGIELVCHFPGFTAPTPVKFFVCSSSALRVSKTRCIVEQPAVPCFSPRCELCSTNRPLRYQLDLDSKHALQSSWTILLEVSSLCAGAL